MFKVKWTRDYLLDLSLGNLVSKQQLFYNIYNYKDPIPIKSEGDPLTHAESPNIYLQLLKISPCAVWF